jgi:inorganic triphosphatase YgiF
VEIKFRADPATISAVLDAPLLSGVTVSPEREIISTYFDTQSRELKRNGLTLRLRRKGRAAPVLGVKWTAETTEDAFTRGEIEVRAPDGMPDINLFEPVLRDRLKAMIGDAALTPLFETRFKRRTAVVTHGRSDIELAVDDGVIIAGNSRLPLTELELELKSGNTADLVNCARELAKECGLSLQFEPKAGRGYRLLEGEAARPQKALPVALTRTANFDDVITAVISNSLMHFVANWTSLSDSDAPESIHQLRVALRRMRSALSIFRKAITLPELEDIRSEARCIASALGPARECDAFRQNALAGPFRNEFKRFKSAVRLLEVVETRRQESYVIARRTIDDPATTLFVLDVQSFLLRRAWRTALSPQDLGLLASEARAFAGPVLDRLRRRVVKRGKHLPDMPDEERHELRIALKNLRYAVEFFGGPFGNGKDTRDFLRIVADLQEDLGIHNDAVTAESFIATLNIANDVEAQFAAGYLLGYYRHATIAADTHLSKKWKNFRRATAFWT